MPPPALVARFLRLAGFIVTLEGLGGVLFVDQRLPVGVRNLVVIRMNLVERKKTVAVSTVVNKRRLERRLNPGYFGKEYASAKQFSRSRLVVKLLYAASSHAQFRV